MVATTNRTYNLLEEIECTAAWYNVDNWQPLIYSEYCSEELEKYKQQ